MWQLLNKNRLASLIQNLLRHQAQTQVEAADYQKWRRKFLYKRLQLNLQLALIGLLTFIALEIRDFFFSREYFEALILVIYIIEELSLLVCFILLKTKFFQRYPSVIFLIFAWSVTLIPIIINTVFAGKIEADILGWPLTFFGMATLIPVYWQLHLTTQLGVFIYYVGIQFVLDKAATMPTTWMNNSLLFLYMFWVCFVCDLSVYLYERLQRSEFRTRYQMELAYQQLAIEQEQSERLLLNILPQSIAHRLKQSTGTLAEHFSEASVLFADIVGFTELSAKIPPTEMVELLNKIFSLFDQLAEKHDLEKIKTIGDAYMVVSGLPTPRQDHAIAIANMALDMQQELAKFNTENNQKFQIRIGINTGPVVAGVIGLKKFIYDLWGDTVNIASRMESHGIPGSIQVTSETYELLKNHYVFVERGIIHVKGRGNMKTYLLKSKISETTILQN
ncbi:adenylate/guanylate cyclase domain-containing protein [Floridanema evergladense]|uniref:Adenylate/guanylate cyclase domain-containing protein n=1 Tax=Floridaenema evergladense BLCC-F167 TaxID=3153639 RepID=A0ABV4WGR6_9CYAN